jgi:hypothetical protein
LVKRGVVQVQQRPGFGDIGVRYVGPAGVDADQLMAEGDITVANEANDVPAPS